jgi:hypothetical protein
MQIHELNGNDEASFGAGVWFAGVGFCLKVARWRMFSPDSGGGAN